MEALFRHLEEIKKQTYLRILTHSSFLRLSAGIFAHLTHPILIVLKVYSTAESLNFLLVNVPIPTALANSVWINGCHHDIFYILMNERYDISYACGFGIWYVAQVDTEGSNGGPQPTLLCCHSSFHTVSADIFPLCQISVKSMKLKKYDLKVKRSETEDFEFQFLFSSYKTIGPNLVP